MFFGSNGEYFLGIDFGTRSIKVVEIRIVKGKANLVNYGQVILDKAKKSLLDRDNDYSVLLKEGLEALLSKLKLHSKKVSVAIPAFNGLVMMVDFPKMTEEELAKAIKYESVKHIPMPLDDVNVSWEIIESLENDEEKTNKNTMKVLLVAAPKTEVSYYDNLLKGTNLDVELLELETFSLSRILAKNSGKKVLMLADIGAKTTNLVLLVNGIVRVNRNIDIGGIDLTNSIADNMKISSKRAREMKESDKNLLEGVTSLEFPSIDYIVSEINRMKKIQNIDFLDETIIAGGSSKMKGIDSYLERELGSPVNLADPMKYIKSTFKDKSGNPIVLDSSYCVAAGLALHGLDK